MATFAPSAIDTPFGRVEYAQAGDGPPVMVVHGVLGGFDFGVGVGRVKVPEGYRIISPVPTLVAAAEDDTLAPYEDSRAMAARIPGARFVTVRRGGHTLTQLDASARRAVAEFIGAAGRPVAPESPVLAEGG